MDKGKQFREEDKEQDFESDDDDLIISPAKNLFNTKAGNQNDQFNYSLSNEDDKNNEKVLEKKKRKNKKKKRKRKEKKIMQQQQLQMDELWH